MNSTPAAQFPLKYWMVCAEWSFVCLSRNLLCSLVRVKLSCYEMESQCSLSVEDYLKAFLENEVKPLWPKGWMQARSECVPVFISLCSCSNVAFYIYKQVPVGSWGRLTNHWDKISHDFLGWRLKQWAIVLMGNAKTWLCSKSAFIMKHISSVSCNFSLFMTGWRALR